MAVPVRSFDEALLSRFLARLDQLEADRVLTPVITLDRLREFLDDGQRDLVEQIIRLRPGDYGVETPYAGDLEPHVFEKYTALNDAFADEHPGRQLLIQSCYRSPACQVAVFVGWLAARYQGDIGQAIRHVSPPAYSQHTIASKAAIDFKNVDGSPSDTSPGDFAYTAEYAWLRQHAARFRFQESWLPGNEFGMGAEPWHWQYRPPPREADLG